ncbi:hypothetical protein Y032_0002g1141 [Ancylostoma ceylanicum]|uniref:Uncharacterized protein n=1 Tax=Ancylostoma ceylanicum TaxID=53326 RepID=A0A016W0R6_9BILA|nr:hypothetical protein Y032_0002g1141 [Ancylostoma ceylanicum]
MFACTRKGPKLGYNSRGQNRYTSVLVRAPALRGATQRQITVAFTTAQGAVEEGSLRGRAFKCAACKTTLKISRKVQFVVCKILDSRV